MRALVLRTLPALTHALFPYGCVTVAVTLLKAVGVKFGGGAVIEITVLPALVGVN